MRTLDRRHRRGLLAEEELPARRNLLIRLLEAMERVELTSNILQRAADPFPTPLATLDAIHLATALLYARAQSVSLTVATHDQELAAAAQATGLMVIGV